MTEQLDRIEKKLDELCVTMHGPAANPEAGLVTQIALVKQWIRFRKRFERLILGVIAALTGWNFLG